MLIWGISLADSIMFSQVLVYFKLFVVRYHCICWTSKFVVLQKKGVLTHGKFNLKKKKFSPNWNKPHFFFPLSLSLCCILSQLSWARALWIILPVEVLGSPWISGSFCRGRRWDLVTWMQVPKSTRKSPEFLESQSLPDGSRCGTPVPVIVLSLISLRTFVKWRGVRSPSHPVHVSCTVSSVGWWEGPGAAQSHAQEQGHMRMLKDLNWAVGNFRGHWVPTHLWLSLAAWKCVHENCSHWQLTVLLGKKKRKKKVTSISGAPKLLLLRIIEISK